MPQIWLTYDEAGAFLGCEASVAREHAIRRSWDRKKSRDGYSRLKLPAAEMAAYLDHLFETRLAAMQASSAPVREMKERAAAFLEGRRAA